MQKQSMYETVFIIDLSLGNEKVEELQNKFINLITANGTIDKTDIWGERVLAYPINDLTKGYYVLVKFSAAPDFPAELERIFNITDGILRSLTIKLEEEKKKD